MHSRRWSPQVESDADLSGGILHRYREGLSRVVVGPARFHGERANPESTLIVDHLSRKPVTAKPERAQRPARRVERATTASGDRHGAACMISMFVGQDDSREPLEIDTCEFCSFFQGAAAEAGIDEKGRATPREGDRVPPTPRSENSDVHVVVAWS